MVHDILYLSIPPCKHCAMVYAETFSEPDGPTAF